MSSSRTPLTRTPLTRTPLALTLTAIAALTLSACSDDAPQTDGPDSATDAGEDEQADGEQAEGEEGNGDEGEDSTSPEGAGQDASSTAYQLGEEVQVGDWVVVVTDVNEDATDVILAEDETNEPPVEGRQFVMVTIDATYNGTATGTAWVDLSLGIDGADGTTYEGGVDDFCGIQPNSLFDLEEQSPGETVTGTHCAALPEDQVAGSQLGLENFLAMDGERQLVDLVPNN